MTDYDVYVIWILVFQIGQVLWKSFYKLDQDLLMFFVKRLRLMNKAKDNLFSKALTFFAYHMYQYKQD